MRTRRTGRRTKAFEADPELEDEFFIAEKLGMTVARMRSEMTHYEFVQWCVYFGRKNQRRELAQWKMEQRRR